MNTATTIISDKRYKQDIISLNGTSALNFVKQLNPCTFRYIDFGSESTLYHGLIAQEVLIAAKTTGETVEDIVVNGENYNPDDPESLRMGINYQFLVAHLVKSIQVLESRLTAIESTQ